MNLLRAATLTVRDPEATAARYVEWMDYQVVERGALDAGLASSWGAPAATGRPFVVCRPASGAEVYLRFVAGQPPADYLPLRTFGWAALEISVADTLAVEQRLLASPFTIIGPPRELDGMPDIFPMQIRGPDDEIVYLTQIRAQPQGVRLAAAESLIDRLFILVLASSDLDATARWFARHLGLVSRPEAVIRYAMLSKAFELPPDTRHRIGTGGHDLDVFLEFDQYPPGAAARPRTAGDLPPGIALVTLGHPDLDAVSAPWVSPPQARDGVIYAGQPQGVTSAPDGIMIELVSSPWQSPGSR